jgi:death-on-curing protein
VIEPEFLTLDDVLALHADRLATYGGSRGLRDLGGLQSALGMPSATFDGRLLHATLAEMAAAYLFHVCQAHAFVDGNKRIGLAAALAFVEINDHELVADPDELFDVVVGVASGQRTKADVAVFFAKHLRRLSTSSRP